MKVTADGFAQALQDVLERYGQDIQEGVNQAVETAGKQALKTVREKSPVSKSRSGGKYKKGWKLQKTKGGIAGRSTSVTVYNAARGSRTHLLEDGHQKANGGRVEGIPHIAPAVEAAEKSLDATLPKAIEEAADDL